VSKVEKKKRIVICVFSSLALFILAGLFLYQIRNILMPFLLAILLAYILLPFVEFLVYHRFSMIGAILTVYFGCSIIILILVLYVFPGIFSELTQFAGEIPFYAKSFQNSLLDWQDRYSRFNIPDSIRQIVDENILFIEAYIIEVVRSSASIIIGLFSYTFSLIILPILTYYFLKDHKLITQKIVSFLPPGKRSEILGLWFKINLVLRRFIYGHLTVAFLVGVLTIIGLKIIGVNYAVTLGFIAGLADIIPYFGPFIGAVPAVCLAYLQSKKLALYTVIVMVVIQQIESSIITPKIISDSVGLHPLTIIFVLLLGGFYFGIWGMLFAVPMIAVLRILINYLYQKAVGLKLD
jgi:predicted PurR-regulated permease PerM